ncbi:unnamed protein product [Linum trigynum]|uniref:Pentatricopeptide repeat-containing protein n=1 Tax=Linum trigynum TaxID=586398 RepID=A0AAV2GC35_9ROSI
MRFLFIPRRTYSAALTAPFSRSNSQISHFARTGQIDRARQLFDNMPERNTVSWNGLISGYVKNGMTGEAREALDKMPERNVLSWTAMLRGYVQEGMIEEAERLFSQMPVKNVVSWTVMIGELIEDGRVDEALKLFYVMPVNDVVARTSMIGGLCSEGRLKVAREIFDEMPERNVVAWTTMINVYVIHNKVDLARKLFEVMPGKNEKDDVPWSSMIKVYERKGFELEALGLFRLMQLQGIRPNFPSMISTLSVCGSLAILNHGREVHAQLVRSMFDFDVYVCSVLITMYIKCGDLVKGKLVFDRFTFKDTVMWNSIITGYAQHGLGKEALQVFYDMVSSGVPPDEVTFIGVLSACSYTGRVKEGIELFESMKSKYLVNPKTEHYSCVVDLLGRAGKLNEAMN